MTLLLNNGYVLGAGLPPPDPIPGIFPGNYARILWHSYHRAATWTATNNTTANPVVNLANDMTRFRFRPSAPSTTITADVGTAVKVQAFGIAAHTLGTVEGTVTFQYSNDNSNWTNATDPISPERNTAFMVIFDEVEARYWRVIASGNAAFSIGVCFFGPVLEMMRPVYGGVTPPNMARQTDLDPMISGAGEWLQQTVKRRGEQTEITWRHLKADWVRSEFDPFAESRTPFFIAWNPRGYPQEVSYCIAPSDFAATNMGTRDYMEVTVPFVGYLPRVLV